MYVLIRFSAEFLAEAYRLMVEEDYDSVFSVCRQKKFRWSESESQKMTTSSSRSSTAALAPSCDQFPPSSMAHNRGHHCPPSALPSAVSAVAAPTAQPSCNTRPLNFDPVRRPRRQDWKGDLVENGMFYFAKRQLLETQGLLQGGRKCTYVEVDAKLSLEIDSSLDLALAQQIVLHQGLTPFSGCNSCPGGGQEGGSLPKRDGTKEPAVVNIEESKALRTGHHHGTTEGTTSVS